MVTSPGDRFIDHDQATRIPARIAETNRVPALWHEIPSSMMIGHEAVDPARLGPAKDLLYARYIRLYEGRR